VVTGLKHQKEKRSMDQSEPEVLLQVLANSAYRH
jgi:hypothetical protein